MRGLLALSCRAFPRDHRARTSDEIVDTALLAAEGSALRTVREALSLVVAGARQRLRAESHRSLRDGAAPLAGVLAIVNLAVALAGMLSGLTTYSGPSLLLWNLRYGPGAYPFVIDWWWVAFAAAGALIVFGLVRGHRGLAAGAAMANLVLVAYDASGFSQGVSHFNVFTVAYGFPGSRQWLVAAIVLAVATAAARLRRFPLTRLAFALVVVGLLVWLALLARERGGSFFILRWPLAVIILLGVAFGAVAPRLAVLACGVTLAAIPSVVAFLIGPNPYATSHPSVALYLTGPDRWPTSEAIVRSEHHAFDPVAMVVVAGGLALGSVLLAQLARRRLTRRPPRAG
jgi:hypothetical protein